MYFVKQNPVIPISILGVRGVRILQQLIPFRHSSVQIRLSTGAAILRTENVARMSLSEPAISPIDWDQRHITVDDTVVNLEKSSGKPASSNLLSVVYHSYRFCILIVLQDIQENLQRFSVGRAPLPGKYVTKNPLNLSLREVL